MEGDEKITLELSKEELQILVWAVSSSQPLSAELEALQFILYHKLLFKLNELK